MVSLVKKNWEGALALQPGATGILLGVLYRKKIPRTETTRRIWRYSKKIIAHWTVGSVIDGHSELIRSNSLVWG